MLAESEKSGDGKSVLALEIGQAIYFNVALLLFMDVVILLASLPLVIAFLAGGILVVPAIGAVTLGPIWGGTIAVADRIVRKDSVSIRTFVENIVCNARTGIVLSFVPAVVGTAALGTLQILASRPHDRWLMFPLVVDGMLAVLILLAEFSLFSLAVTGGLRGWTLWRVSLGLRAASAMSTFGTIALVVLMSLLVAWAGPGWLFVLPAPFAVYLSAITWTTYGKESQQRPH